MRSGRQPETILTVSDLIDSGQFQRAEKLFKTEPPDEPLGLVYQVEVDIYFDRLDEAGKLLEHIQPRDLSADEMARYALARGEWYYRRVAYQPAEQHFRTAEHMYRLIDDELGLAKALYNLGRLKRCQAQLEAGQTLFHQARELMKDHKGKKKDYLQALIEFDLGVCAHQLDKLDEAAEFYSSAMVMLNKLERGKHYGEVLKGYGALLRRVGKYDESLSVLEEAIGIFQGFGPGDALGATMNDYARTLIRVGRLEEAEASLKESSQQFQQAGNVAGAPMVLEISAVLYLKSGELIRGEKCAKQAIEQAELSQNELLKAEALITLGCIEIKRSDYYAAVKLLQHALEIGQQLNNRMIQITAMLYLSECELPMTPIKAQQRITEVRKILQTYDDVQLQQELERICQRAKGERIKVTPDNKLIINGNFLPNWYNVKQAMESFLLKNALRQSEGNLTKAGKILGITKVHVHDKKKQHGL